jgi:CheY-like chemotaxis protein
MAGVVELFTFSDGNQAQPFFFRRAMKTILVLSSHPGFAETIRAGLNPAQYRVVHRLTVDEAEPLLAHGLVTASVLDADLLDVQIVWAVDRLRRHDSRSPVIVYASASESAWEEEAFLHGVNHVLTKPVRARLLNSLLERLEAAPVQPAVSAPTPSQNSFSSAPEPGRPVNPSPTLDVLRDFSSILTYSLNAEAMLKQFLSFLREILSVNRAAIFLNRPCRADQRNGAPGQWPESSRHRCRRHFTGLA